jgi:hypothetical protein
MKNTKIVSFVKLSRAHLWFYQKLPPVLAVAYAQILLTNIQPPDAYAGCVAILIALTGCALFGYFLNDWFDIAQDRLAGKPNRMESVSPKYRWIFPLTALLLGFFPFWFQQFPAEALFVVTIDYVFSFLYSTPAFRWKERPVPAIVLDAAAAHFLPVILVFAMFPDAFTLFSVAACVWALFNGLRQIVLHQLWDYQNDTRAGVVTFVRRIGFARAQSVLSRLIFPVELIAFLVLAFAIFQTNRIFAVPVVLYAVILTIKSRIWKRSIQAAPAVSTNHIPPNDFYETWFPVSLAALLVLQDFRFLLLLVGHMLIFYKHLKRREMENLRLLKDCAKMSLRFAKTNG